MHQKMSIRNMVILLSILVAALIVVYIYGVFVIQRGGDRMQQLSEELVYEVGRAERLSLVEDVIRNTEEDRDQLMTYFLTEDTVINFITTIESLASTTRTILDVSSINVIEGSGLGVDTLQVRIGGSGSWNAVFHLIAILETMPYPTTITNVTLAHGGVDEETGIADWKVLIDTNTLMLQ